MPLELFIAIRYLKARRKGVFTLLTTIIAVGGIMLGVASLIITLAVMSGFHSDIKKKILTLQPHIVLIKDSSYAFRDYEKISARVLEEKGVQAVSPFIYGQIILRNGDFTSGGVVKGIDWAGEEKLVRLGGVLKEKDITVLGDDEIILGQELARKLGAAAGRDVIVMCPGQFDAVPKMKKYRVKTVFHSGMYDFDDNLSFITISSAQKLFDMAGSVTGIGISVKNWESADSIAMDLQEKLSYPYTARSWQRMNRNLFSALKLEKIMMFIILTLIILVAAFNIISNLLLLTVEKAREIGILSALGIGRYKIGKIFFYEGFMIGGAGVFLGLVLGLGLSQLLKTYHFIQLPADVYYVDTLPVKILPGDVLSVVVAAFLITLVAVIYPAYQATKLDPLDTIRYG